MRQLPECTDRQCAFGRGGWEECFGCPEGRGDKSRHEWRLGTLKHAPRRDALVLLAGLLWMCAAAAAGPGPQRIWADDQTNVLGGPSKDGRFLSFVHPKTGDLAVREISGRIRRLTEAPAGQFAYFSAVSPDSKRIAYAWFNEERFYELRAIGADGSDDTLLYRNEEAGFVQPCAWSPDGRYILTLLFRKDNISQIALLPASGGSPRVLKSLNWIYPKRMDFSPDGKHIVYDAFARDGSRRRDIYVLAVDGSKESVLVQHPAEDVFPLWSPDGAQVYFASDRSGSMGLWSVPASGGEASLAQANIGRFLPLGITRDGLLFFGLRHGETDIYSAPLAGGPASRIPTRFRGRNAVPEWSADARSVAFLSRRGTENYGQDSRVITIRDLETGKERELQTPLAHIERVRWSPDGRQLLSSGSDGKGRSGIFTVDAGTGRLTPVATDSDATFRGYDGAWLPNGQIVYARGRSLWIDRREVRTFDCEPALPAASASAQLAFACGNGVYVMRSDGSELVRLAQISDKHRITAVRWSSSGQVLFASGPAVFRAKPESGATLIATFEGSHGDIALHPEGKIVAFTTGSTRSEIWTLRMPR